VTIDPAEGAGIGGWDIRPVRHALTAVMRRRPESYHTTLREHEAAASGATPAGTDTTTSIHEMVMAKEPDLATRLHYDAYERRSGLVRFLAPGTTPDDWAAGRAVELGDAVDQAFEVATIGPRRVVLERLANVSGAAVRVAKTVVLTGDRRAPALSLTVDLTNGSDRTVEAIFGIESTIMMLGGGGNPAAWFKAGGVRGSHDGSGTASAISSFAQGNDAVGVALETRTTEPAGLWWAPVETVSNSEGGFERSYQGAGILVWWALSLDAGASRSVTIDYIVTTTADMAADERA
jgi:alpha-amylase